MREIGLLRHKVIEISLRSSEGGAMQRGIALTIFSERELLQ